MFKYFLKYLDLCYNVSMRNAVDEIKLSTEETQAVRVMQLLGDKTRYKIFKLLLSEREMCVSEIASELGISVSAVSQHFRSFEIIGLVDKQRQGQKICYEINYDDKFINKLADIAKGE